MCIYTKYLMPKSIHSNMDNKYFNHRYHCQKNNYLLPLTHCTILKADTIKKLVQNNIICLFVQNGKFSHKYEISNLFLIIFIFFISIRIPLTITHFSLCCWVVKHKYIRNDTRKHPSFTGPFDYKICLLSSIVLRTAGKPLKFQVREALNVFH